MNMTVKEDFGLFNFAAEDNKGFIWISGTKGLNVFDGHSLVSYTSSGTAYPLQGGSKNEGYHFILKDTAGVLYVRRVRSGGFICFDPRKRSSLDTVISPDREEVLEQLSISPRNEILGLSINRATGHFTIREYTGRKSGRIVHKGSLSLASTTIFSFYAGQYWFASGSQLMRIDPSTLRVHPYTLPAPGGIVAQLYEDHGRIYLFVDRGRIYTLNPGKDMFEEKMRLQSQITNQAANLAVIDGLFIAANEKTLQLLDSTGKVLQDLSQELMTLTRTDGPDGLVAGVQQIFITHDRKIFLLTQKRMYRMQVKEPSISQFREKLSTEPDGTGYSFRALAEDEQHTIYASYYTDIVQRKAGQKMFTPFAYIKNETISKSGTYSLNYWNDKLIWNNILIDRRTGQHELIGPTQYYAGHSAQYLHNDTVWVFPWWSDSLYYYDLQKKMPSSLRLDKSAIPDKRPIEEMSELTGDNTGQYLWMATKWCGIILAAKNGKLLKQYSPAVLKMGNQSVPSVYALQLGTDGLWYGCDEGLGLLHPETGKAEMFYNPLIDKNGLLKNRAVFSILAVSDSSFYLGTSRGIVYFNTRKRRFCNLTEDNPLGIIEFNRASAFHASDGRYYFGSTDGLYSFLPGELKFHAENKKISPLTMYNISYFNNNSKQYYYLDTDKDEILSFGPSASNIEFHFAVPEYEQDVYYSYRIKGQSDEWTAYSPANVISLYYIPPGDYVLEIKASVTFNNEKASYLRLPFRVVEEWYKRKWVILLFIFLLLGLIVGTILYISNQRLRQQAKLASLRTKISSDLHDDVGSVLSGIALQSEMLAYTAPDEQKTSFSQISEMSREVMDSMRDIVWAMDSRKDKYENLVDRMRAFAERNFSAKNIKSEFILRDIDTGKFIDPEKRQTIYLIFKEAITNIIRHSNCSHVLIGLTQQHDTFSMMIHDNGEGSIANSDGLGISNMKMRAQKIGATLTTSADTGFMIHLEVPMI